uniref:Uncharacterized protein n=1 Tax=Crocodylus porosus TaxID=8502 RepID=A0A7M4FGY2_CROPO
MASNSIFDTFATYSPTFLRGEYRGEERRPRRFSVLPPLSCSKNITRSLRTTVLP